MWSVNQFGLLVKHTKFDWTIFGVVNKFHNLRMSYVDIINMHLAISRSMFHNISMYVTLLKATNIE